MISGAIQEPPSTDGIDWSDGFQVQQYQLSQNEWIRKMVEAIARKANEPRYIVMPDGKPLSDLGDGQPWSGVVWLLDTTLSEAYRQCARHGFRVMDGSGGTQDMRDKFVKGAASGNGAGETGGSASFCSQEITIQDHTAHSHTNSVSAPSSSSCPYVACVSGEQAASTSHTHTVTINDNTDGLTHTITQADISIIPPYYEMIFARKA